MQVAHHFFYLGDAESEVPRSLLKQPSAELSVNEDGAESITDPFWNNLTSELVLAIPVRDAVEDT